MGRGSSQNQCSNSHENPTLNERVGQFFLKHYENLQAFTNPSGILWIALHAAPDGADHSHCVSRDG